MDRPRRDRRPRRDEWRDRRERRPFSSARPREEKMCAVALSFFFLSRFGISRPCPVTSAPAPRWWPPSDGRTPRSAGSSSSETAGRRRRVRGVRRRRGSENPDDFSKRSITRGAGQRAYCRREERRSISWPCLQERLCPARRTRWSIQMTPPTRSRGSLGRSTRFWSGTRSSASGRRPVSRLLEV